MSEENSGCCLNCRYCFKLEKADHTGRGCEDTPMDGFACTCFGDEGIVKWMVGLDPHTAICECWQKKRRQGDKG